jgi:hypothetical protein
VTIDLSRHDDGLAAWLNANRADEKPRESAHHWHTNPDEPIFRSPAELFQTVDAVFENMIKPVQGPEDMSELH